MLLSSTAGTPEKFLLHTEGTLEFGGCSASPVY